MFLKTSFGLHKGETPLKAIELYSIFITVEEILSIQNMINIIHLNKLFDALNYKILL